MRWSLLLLLVVLPRLAFAEPKVAVAPLDGDDGKVAEVVGEIVSERAKLTKPGRVEGAMKSMGVGVLSTKSVKKLRNKLGVDVVIYGKLERDGRVKKLALTFAGSGKATLEIEFASDKSLRKELSGKLAKRISSAMNGSGGDDGDEEELARAKKDEERKREEARKRREEEEERKREEERQAERKRRDDEDRRKKDDDDRRADRRKKKGDNDDEDRGRRKKRVADDDEDRGRRKKRVAEDDEDSSRARKRLGDEEDEEEDDEDDRPRRKQKSDRRHALTQSALWLDAGGTFARRTLTYAATGTMRPPRVGTAAPAGRIAGEVYPAAFSSLDGAAAAVGIAGAYTRTFGLGIDVPGTTITTPVNDGNYQIGALYRFTFGQHAFALGVSYWRRYYMADRAALTNPDQLDMPDVDYKAIAPGLSLRVAATPKITAFASVDVPLMLNSGPIQDPASYGAAKILAFDVRGGSQIMVADHIAVQIAAEVEQIGLKFTGQLGSKAMNRMVSAATDRSIGIAATIGVAY